MAHLLKGRAPVASSRKRPQASKSSPGVENNNDKKLRSGESASTQAVPEESSLSFACPFYKWDAAIYGGEGGCSSWGNKSLESLIRYHILDKHRKANKARIAKDEDHYLDDARFEEVDKFKKTKGLGDSKEEHAENKWRAVYALLFDIHPEAKGDVPDPYFKADAESETLGFSIEDLVRMMTNRLPNRPWLVYESVDFVQAVDKLKRERTRQKEKVQTAAAARESEVRIQIREINEQRALQEQKIDVYFDHQIHEVRSRYMAILSPGPDHLTQPHQDPPPLPLFDFDADFDLELPNALQAPRPQGSVENSTYAQPGMHGQSTAGTLEQHASTVTSMAGTPQQLPGNPAYDMDRCGICPTTIANESMWCGECRPLTNLSDIQ